MHFCGHQKGQVLITRENQLADQTVKEAARQIRPNILMLHILKDSHIKYSRAKPVDEKTIQNIGSFCKIPP